MIVTVRPGSVSENIICLRLLLPDTFPQRIMTQVKLSFDRVFMVDTIRTLSIIRCYIKTKSYYNNIDTNKITMSGY